MEIRISLLGNPNVGKTTLYNDLTKSFEHIGNWHGVTVEAKSKTFKSGGDTVTITDLPGIYSLTVYSKEEAVSRDNVLSGRNDIIINICEVNNLARNLYLTLQLAELGVPLILAVNMTDELRLQGKTIDYAALSGLLGVPVMAISAKYKKKTAELLSEAVRIAKKHKADSQKVLYKSGISRILLSKEIASIISFNAKAAGLDADWCAIKLVENDPYVRERLMLDKTQESAANKAAAAIYRAAGFSDGESFAAARRYEEIDKIAAKCIGHRAGAVRGFSGIDRLLLNKWLALPIFILVMAAVFFLTFGFVGKFLSAALDALINDTAGGAAFKALSDIGAPVWIRYLIKDGVFGGAGSIITFLPQITLLFLFLALLEDTGYLSRVAYMTDGLFGKIGLSGRSVFTMLMGFGCSATAVMTARNCESESMRIKTVLITPFMSCSARLPVYATVAAAFFINQWLMIFLLYMLGIAVALLVSLVLDSIPRFKCPRPDFIMEMSPYRLPALSRVIMIIWKNIRAFLTRVATVVFGLTVIIWILSNFTFTFRYVPDAPGAVSMMQHIGGLIAWIFAPLGFGNWQAATALLSGFVAKETVIAALQSIAHSDVSAVLNNDMAAAAAFVVFVLLYVPCVSAVSAIKKEVGARLMWVSVIMQLGIAYAVSFVVYWTGRLFLSGDPGLIAGVLTAAAILAYSAIVLYKSAQNRAKCKNCTGCTSGKSCNVQKYL